MLDGFDRQILAMFFVLGVNACPWVAYSNADEIPLPPAVADRIGRAQIFSYRIKDKKILAGSRDIVWGDEGQKVPGVYSIKYMPTDRDPDRKHDMTWYKENHPDWVIYKADQQTPAHEFKYSWGYNTPVDTNNPAVRQYLFDVNVKSIAGAQRYEGMAVDNVECRNEWLRSGVWQDGQWHQYYQGKKKVDAAYARDTADWLDWLRSRLHAQGMSLVANHYPHAEDEAGYRLVASKIDIICDEQGYTRKGHALATDKKWLAKMTLFSELAQTKPMIVIDQLTADPTQITPEIKNWALANYLLLKGDHTYVAWPTENAYGRLDEYRELYLPIGRPLESFTQAGDVYRRRFEKVLALVNPAKSDAATYQLDSGPWFDLDGVQRTGAISLPPASGLVLVRDKAPVWTGLPGQPVAPGVRD